LQQQACSDEGDVLHDLVGGTLSLNPAVCAQLRARRLTEVERSATVEFAGLSHRDVDLPVLVAQLPDLSPSERPPSPVPAMLDALQLSFEGVDGETLTEEMPEKPTTWTALFPEADLTYYPLPPEIRALDHTVITNPDTPGDTAEIHLIRNDNELQANRDYMGNCTWAYRGQCAEGTSVIGRIYHGRETYNFQWDHQGNGRWRLREINGYQNQRDRVERWVLRWAETAATQLRADPRRRAA
jgi:hypothetical protein